MVRVKNLVFDIVLAGFIFILALLLLSLSSCKHQLDIIPAPIQNTGTTGGNSNPIVDGSTCSLDSVYFQSVVLPLIVSNCAQSTCHNATDHGEGIILDSYANIMNFGSVRPLRPSDSKLYEVLTTSEVGNRMPPAANTQLTSSQIGIIYSWIAQGAQNNQCENSCDTTNVTYSSSIVPILQTNCNGCPSGATPSGSINLSGYQDVRTFAQNGRLWGAVNHSTGYRAMPSGGQLTACNLDKLRIWITDGSLNN